MADFLEGAPAPRRDLHKIPCARVTPHYSHEWQKDNGGGPETATAARCPGVRNVSPRLTSLEPGASYYYTRAATIDNPPPYVSQCPSTDPHGPHDWALAPSDTEPEKWNRCDGWPLAPRYGPGNPPPERDDNSPFPCRCYFVNGRRVTNDCTVGHNRTWDREEASVLALAVLNAPEKTRTDALLSAMHTLILIASDDNADARFARRQLAKIEEAVNPDYAQMER